MNLRFSRRPVPASVRTHTPTHLRRFASTLAFTLALLGLVPSSSRAAELHVAITGSDAAPGSRRQPLRTIQHAAELAQPGDTITVHAGTYRERVHPPRGGVSDSRRITFRAAPREHVEIKGSEPVTGWTQVGGDTWTVSISNSLFGAFNPYTNLIRGDWFESKGRDHHTGAVYLDGHWLTEARTLEEVLQPVALAPDLVTELDPKPAPLPRPLWFARVDATSTTFWAQFPATNPNQHQVEINVRQSVFYPDQPGCNYLTVRGFHLRHAATPWAPPTAEQIALLGTHWSKGWIIEDNVVTHSVCSGISLGKHGDAWDNTSANSAEGYVKTIERAFARGWNRDTIGHHVVRRNTIAHCEQAGIVGSLGAAFSTVADNHIHDIHVRRLFTGAEMAGIKFHAAIDTVIRDNHIHRTCLGLWLDWMAQGTRVTGNLFHDNLGQDLFVEVNHGPFLVDHNLFLSPVSLLDVSEGGAFAHNLFRGRIISHPEPNRDTPFHPPHSTAIAGLAPTRGGDHRFLNNLVLGPATPQPKPGLTTPPDPGWHGDYGLWMYDFRELPLQTGGNVFYPGTRPYTRDRSTPRALEADHDPRVRLVRTRRGLQLEADFGSPLRQADTVGVSTDTLGIALVARAPYVDAQGSNLRLNRDYLGRTRSSRKPTPGPFEHPDPAGILVTRTSPLAPE
ncbi:MAG: right-handed parallel beta-helix repeat-containing protein [Verrucomicrobiales bacterium]|nr:right-handed parallel beta-helix repeat-containing protein [Verrucomicrobiales bacterium]